MTFLNFSWEVFVWNRMTSLSWFESNWQRNEIQTRLPKQANCILSLRENAISNIWIYFHGIVLMSKKVKRKILRSKKSLPMSLHVRPTHLAHLWKFRRCARRILCAFIQKMYFKCYVFSPSRRIFTWSFRMCSKILRMFIKFAGIPF